MALWITSLILPIFFSLITFLLHIETRNFKSTCFPETTYASCFHIQNLGHTSWGFVLYLVELYPFFFTGLVMAMVALELLIRLMPSSNTDKAIRFSMTRRIPTAVLISGNGSNLQALLDAASAPDYPAAITFVLSNKADAYGLTRAKNAGVETLVIDHKNYASRSDFDAAMTDALEARGIELVVMAGFMRILSDGFVNHWAGKLINIHPSLLPKYKGTHTHQRAIDAGETEHGATVHWVIPELDAGDIIAQARCPIMPDDTAETLQQRVHALEHQIYPQAVAQVAHQLLTA